MHRDSVSRLYRTWRSGAFMSMLGITLLNELFGEGRIDKPGAILGQLRSKVKAMLVQEGNIRDQKDGMDMAIAVIDKERRELQFAGAYNPLYHIREKGQVTGKETGSETALQGKDSLLFEYKGDSIYVFSDGFVDQFGGSQRKKFKTQKFKNLLLKIHSEPMEMQKKILEETFEKWRGNIEQIDDVCVIGVRV